jgi:protein-S-isoprenylcysteine O-methyltransferase Ste14
MADLRLDRAPTAGIGVGAASRRVDPGRVAVVLLFALSLLSAGGKAWVTATSGLPVRELALGLASCVLTAAFCVLVVAAYLRRGEARATDRGSGVRLAAPLATCLPLAIPGLPSGRAGSGAALLAFALIIAGTAWSVWAVRHLSTCLSVVPQARSLVDTGPYRLVRHPLYLGELVAVGGFAVRGAHWLHVLLLLALLALQLYRAGREEALLTRQVPGYASYAARTWRIVPGVV